MRTGRWGVGGAAVAIIAAACGGGGATAPMTSDTDVVAAPEDTLVLPDPDPSGDVSLEEAVARRRSTREYTEEPLTLAEISQMLWAAQGITQEGGVGRAAPSAGGTYPLELFVVTPDGLFHYVPDGHYLEVLGGVDLRAPLSAAALDQDWVAEGAAVVVITAVFSRTEQRYGGRAERYVHLEAGHAAQNLLLQAVALGLGAVPVGAFHDDEVRSVLGIPADHVPLEIVPIGRPAGR